MESDCSTELSPPSSGRPQLAAANRAVRRKRGALRRPRPRTLRAVTDGCVNIGDPTGAGLRGRRGNRAAVARPNVRLGSRKNYVARTRASRFRLASARAVDAARVLSRAERRGASGEDRLRDLRDAHFVRALSEHDGTITSHPPGVARHDREIGADLWRKVRLVDYQQVRLRDAGAALARHLVAAGHVDHVDGVVGQLAAVLGGQVVASALDEEELRPDLLHQLLEGEQVVADVLADGGMR